MLLLYEVLITSIRFCLFSSTSALKTPLHILNRNAAYKRRKVSELGMVEWNQRRVNQAKQRSEKKRNQTLVTITIPLHNSNDHIDSKVHENHMRKSISCQQNIANYIQCNASVHEYNSAMTKTNVLIGHQND